jgi:hypothetical protein
LSEYAAEFAVCPFSQHRGRPAFRRLGGISDNSPGEKLSPTESLSSRAKVRVREAGGLHSRETLRLIPSSSEVFPPWIHSLDQPNLLFPAPAS